MFKNVNKHTLPIYCHSNFFFHHTTCESTCDTLSSSATNQGDNTVSVAQGGLCTLCLFTATLTLNHGWLNLYSKTVSFPRVHGLYMVYSNPTYDYILYILVSKVKLATVVKGDLKAPFSIATTPRCRGGHYSFPWIAPFYPWSLPYNAEC